MCAILLVNMVKVWNTNYVCYTWSLHG